MLSIVIPTLKEAGYIGDTVRQFKTLPIPHEIIVSDGGSHDGTVSIARSIADQVILHEGHMPTPARERNDGAKLAVGEFVVFVDCGVTIPHVEQFFARLIKQFDVDPTLIAIVGPQQIKPEIETFADHLFLGLQDILIRIWNNVLHVGAGTGKFMFIRRSAFVAIGGFDETLVAGEDHNLIYRLSKRGKTLFDPHTRIYYLGRREHGLGWRRLWWVWSMNLVWILLFNKSYSREWTPVR